MLIGEYERALREAGFGAVQVVDTGSALNANAKVDNQAGCCSPPAEPAVLQISGIGGADGGRHADTDLHCDLAELLRKYDVNDFAASVRVYALKAR